MSCSISSVGGGTPLLIKSDTIASTTTDQDIYTATEDCWVLLYGSSQAANLVVSIKNVGNLFGCSSGQWAINNYANLEGRFPTAGYIAKFRLKNGETLVLNGYANPRTLMYEVYK